LEITEALHLDMRDTYQRGQIWRLGKKADKKKKYSTLQGMLHLPSDGLVIPPADDIVPVLKWTYHTTSVDLTAVNRMPSKIMVSAEDGPDLSSYVPEARREEDTAGQQEAQEHYRREKAARDKQKQEDQAARAEREAADAKAADEKFQEFRKRLANGFRG
jgi:hypothetical protein